MPGQFFKVYHPQIVVKTHSKNFFVFLTIVIFCIPVHQLALLCLLRIVQKILHNSTFNFTKTDESDYKRTQKKNIGIIINSHFILNLFREKVWVVQLQEKSFKKGQEAFDSFAFYRFEFCFLLLLSNAFCGLKPYARRRF